MLDFELVEEENAVLLLHWLAADCDLDAADDEALCDAAEVVLDVTDELLDLLDDFLVSFSAESDEDFLIVCLVAFFSMFDGVVGVFIFCLFCLNV